MAKKVLMIVGSMREQSFNRQLAKMIEEKIKGSVEVSWLDYKDIPYMDQDVEYPAPAQIQRVREQVSAADGIWFVTPEYNYSYPGVLKNLLDWLSRPLEPGDRAAGTAISGKRAAISGVAGKSAAKGAREKLTELLGFMKLELLPEVQTGISLGAEAFASNELVLTEQENDALAAQAEMFLKFLES